MEKNVRRGRRRGAQVDWTAVWKWHSSISWASQDEFFARRKPPKNCFSILKEMTCAIFLSLRRFGCEEKSESGVFANILLTLRETSQRLSSSFSSGREQCILWISSYRVTDNLYENKLIQKVMTKNRSEQISCTASSLQQLFGTNCLVVDRLFKRFQTRLVNNITWKTSCPLPFSRTKISPKMLVQPFQLI